MAKPTKSTPQINKKKPEAFEYVCSCCGRHYAKQKGVFPGNHSPFYTGNNNHLTVCYDCVEKLFEHYVSVLGGQKEAIQRLCLHFDYYFSEDIYELACKSQATKNSTVVKLYISKSNMSQFSGKNYDSTIEETNNKVIDSIDELADLTPLSDFEVTEEIVKKWGLSYTPDEYATLEQNYALLMSKVENDNPVQESLVRDLCSIQIQKERCLAAKEVSNFISFSKLYQETLKSADMKPTGVENAQSRFNAEDCWSNYLKMVENFVPAEVYKDKSLFDDADGIKDYFKRLIVRPFKNFVTGGNDMDEEFSIGAEEES